MGPHLAYVHTHVGFIHGDIHGEQTKQNEVKTASTLKFRQESG